MPTLSQTIAGLREEGYIEDFSLQQHSLECRQGRCQISPNEFLVDKAIRFDNNANPTEEATLYAIHSDVHRLKGILVNAFGTDSEPLTDAMVNKLAFTPGADRAYWMNG